MNKTGIFFHYQLGERLSDFPDPALAGILDNDNISYYDARYQLTDSLHHLTPVSEKLLRQVHAPDMIERVRATGDFQGATYSAGGTVQAGDLVMSREISNAFVFTGYGDHHAGKDFFGGGCYFNSAALSIAALRQSGKATRFAIVDTDAHHGDGTWDIFRDDPDTLYVCLCSQRSAQLNNKVNIALPWRLTDEDYLSTVRSQCVPRLLEHRPDLIYWNFGYDGTVGDYGDIGLTPGCHPELARIFRDAAWNVCQGRLITVLCGGSRRSLARHIIPRIISVLGRLGQ